MGDWDVEMKEICATNLVKIDMSDRYVDDIDTIMGAIPHGYRWTGKRLEYDQQWELEDKSKPLEEHTINIMVAMSTSIRPAIQMEGDCGSNHIDGCIPVLDLKMKMVLLTKPGDPSNNIPTISYYQTYFKFFKKPMARPTTMHANTALPAKMKWETTSNELLRRLLNTIQGLPNSEEDTLAAVNKYMVEMCDSGYDERYHYDTLVNSVKGFRRKVRESEEGVRPLYREAHEGARDRYLSKISASSKWFKGGGQSQQDNLKVMGGSVRRKNPWG